jgi:hypothetical protein
MPLHLIKLCVGAKTVEDHARWIAGMLAHKKHMNLPPEQMHTTRMIPKRKEELLQGGSLYWVTGGMIQSRQILKDIRPFQDDEGIQRCHLVLEPRLILTRPVPRRPFQGWRYLQPYDAPEDWPEGEEQEEAIPDQMRRDLIALGLL